MKDNAEFWAWGKILSTWAFALFAVLGIVTAIWEVRDNVEALEIEILLARNEIADARIEALRTGNSLVRAHLDILAEVRELKEARATLAVWDTGAGKLWIDPPTSGTFNLEGWK